MDNMIFFSLHKLSFENGIYMNDEKIDNFHGNQYFVIQYVL